MRFTGTMAVGTRPDHQPRTEPAMTSSHADLVLRQWLSRPAAAWTSLRTRGSRSFSGPSSPAAGGPSPVGSAPPASSGGYRRATRTVAAAGKQADHVPVRLVTRGGPAAPGWPATRRTTLALDDTPTAGMAAGGRGPASIKSDPRPGGSPRLRRRLRRPRAARGPSGRGRLPCRCWPGWAIAVDSPHPPKHRPEFRTNWRWPSSCSSWPSSGCGRLGRRAMGGGRRGLTPKAPSLKPGNRRWG